MNTLLILAETNNMDAFCSLVEGVTIILCTLIVCAAWVNKK